METKRCGNCKYWQKPQVKTSISTRDYLANEKNPDGQIQYVYSNIGINIAPYCTRLTKDNDKPHIKYENDICDMREI